jgi:tRNA(Ile)-lysidine synthase
MDALVAGGAGWPGAVAVSGGGDSLALMHLLARWAKARKHAPPQVLTVDHRLRKGSGTEARKVARWARDAGLAVASFAWTGAKPSGDVEAEARAARYRLMGVWLRKNGIRALYVAHTIDDQAETFLLRLARGSGVDGLASMRSVAPYPLPDHGGISLVRPLLEFDRDALRAYLAEQGQPWLDDPMNADPRFSRVRLRTAWPALAALGLTKSRVALAAAHLARAREALDWATLAVLQRACRIENGVAYVDTAALASAPHEVGLRALARLLMTVSGQAYRPRFERLARLFARIAAYEVGGGCTLHGCRIALAPKASAVFGAGTLTIARETGRVVRASGRTKPRKLDT